MLCHLIGGQTIWTLIPVPELRVVTFFFQRERECRGDPWLGVGVLLPMCTLFTASFATALFSSF